MSTGAEGTTIILNFINYLRFATIGPSVQNTTKQNATDLHKPSIFLITVPLQYTAVLQCTAYNFSMTYLILLFDDGRR